MKILLFVGLLLVILIMLSGNVVEGLWPAPVAGPYNDNNKKRYLLENVIVLSNAVKNNTTPSPNWKYYSIYFDDPVKTQMINENPTEETKQFIKNIALGLSLEQLYNHKGFHQDVRNALLTLVNQNNNHKRDDRRITKASKLIPARNSLNEIMNV